MPTYEYKCDRCDQVFEVRQKFSDEPLTTHEECGGAVHRLISAPAFQFKGSGWYVTDYARAGSKQESGKESAKSETKPETKSDSNGSKTGASESKTSDSSTKTETKSETKSDTKSETSKK